MTPCRTPSARRIWPESCILLYSTRSLPFCEIAGIAQGIIGSNVRIREGVTAGNDVTNDPTGVKIRNNSCPVCPEENNRGEGQTRWREVVGESKRTEKYREPLPPVRHRIAVIGS